MRKAALAGAAVAFLNPAKFDYKFKVAAYLKSAPAAQVTDLAAVLAAVAAQTGTAVPAHVAGIAGGTTVTDAHRGVATALLSGPKRAVWLGALALRHPQYADLRALAGAIAQLTGAALAELAEGGNAAGLLISPAACRIAKPVARYWPPPARAPPRCSRRRCRPTSCLAALNRRPMP